MNTLGSNGSDKRGQICPFYVLFLTNKPIFGKQYKHELLNNLFFHPYTKIEFIQRDMQVARNTASKYLDMIVDTGLVEKVKVGKSNYYFNTKLINLFLNHNQTIADGEESVDSMLSLK